MVEDENHQLVAGSAERLRGIFSEEGLAIPDALKALKQIDSTDLNSKIILNLYHEIVLQLSMGYKIIVVSTGTDTLEYLAPVIREMFEGKLVDEKIIFTASMQPASHRGDNGEKSDAISNFQALTDGARDDRLGGGTYVAINGVLMGTKGLKKIQRTSAEDPFESSNDALMFRLWGELRKDKRSIRREGYSYFEGDLAERNERNNGNEFRSFRRSSHRSIEFFQLGTMNLNRFSSFKHLLAGDGVIIFNLLENWRDSLNFPLFRQEINKPDVRNRLFHNYPGGIKQTSGDIAAKIFANLIQIDGGLDAVEDEYRFREDLDIRPNDVEESDEEFVYQLTPYSDLSKLKKIIAHGWSKRRIRILAYAPGNFRQEGKDDSLFELVYRSPHIEFIIDSQATEGEMGAHYGAAFMNRLLKCVNRIEKTDHQTLDDTGVDNVKLVGED